MNIIAQVLGVLATIAFAISPQQKSKKAVLIFQFISNVLYSLQYIILGAFSAVATCWISIVNNIVFYKYAQKDKEIPNGILSLFVAIVIIAGILTYNNIFSIIPILLSILYIYGSWQDNLKIYRIVCIIGSIGWFVYNWVVGAYASTLGNGFQCISSIIAMIRLDIIKKEGIKNNDKIKEL